MERKRLENGNYPEENKEDNLIVAVRVRPLNFDELSNGCKPVATVLEENMVCLEDPSDAEELIHGTRSRGKSFVFDYAFGPNSTQNEVYNCTTKPLIDSVLQGYNATIFAYGPTGAGKTFTMLGSGIAPGIMVLTLNDLYNQIEQTSESHKYKVKLSYMELYNEMIRDLLNPSSGYLELRENGKTGVQVAGLSEYEALNTSKVMEMLSIGNQRRMCEPTAVNKTSSRSHALLQVTIETENRVRNIQDTVKVGKLFMIDLAGSERAADTQNTGKRLIEGAHINRSLLALGNCINALSEKGKGAYINYRDSKLTRLLKDSLDGSCKTVMITHITPSNWSFEESRNTLTYADRAKNIKVKPKKTQYSVNYHVAQYQSIITELRDEVVRLKADISLKTHMSAKRPKKSVRSESAMLKEKLRRELQVCFQEQLELKREIIDLEISCMQHFVEYQRHQLIIDEWENQQSRQNIKEPKRFRHKPYNSRNMIAFDAYSTQALKHSKETKQEPADVVTAREQLENKINDHKQLEGRRKILLEKLEDCKKEFSFLQDTCQDKITNAEHKEILVGLCKLHEYELKNIELESMSLMKECLMEQSELNEKRDEMRKNMIYEIVHLQKKIIRENNIKCPVDLDVLYGVYKDEVSKDMKNHVDFVIDIRRLGTEETPVPALPPLKTRPNGQYLKAKTQLESNLSDLDINDRPPKPGSRISVLSVTSYEREESIPPTHTYRVQKLASLSEAPRGAERRKTFVLNSDNDHGNNNNANGQQNRAKQNNSKRAENNDAARESTQRKRSASAELVRGETSIIRKWKDDASTTTNETHKKRTHQRHYDIKLQQLAPTVNHPFVPHKNLGTNISYVRANQNARKKPPAAAAQQTKQRNYSNTNNYTHKDLGELTINGRSFAPKNTMPGFPRL